MHFTFFEHKEKQQTFIVLKLNFTIKKWYYIALNIRNNFYLVQAVSHSIHL